MVKHHDSGERTGKPAGVSRITSCMYGTEPNRYSAGKDCGSRSELRAVACWSAVGSDSPVLKSRSHAFGWSRISLPLKASTHGGNLVRQRPRAVRGWGGWASDAPASPVIPNLVAPPPGLPRGGPRSPPRWEAPTSQPARSEWARRGCSPSPTRRDPSPAAASLSRDTAAALSIAQAPFSAAVSARSTGWRLVGSQVPLLDRPPRARPGLSSAEIGTDFY